MRASTLRHLDARQPCRAASGRKTYVGTNQQSRERATRRGRRAHEDRASSRCLPHDSCMASAYRAHAGHLAHALGVTFSTVSPEKKTRADGCRRRGCEARIGGRYLALKRCSTTVLALSRSVAVTRSVSLPRRCAREICATKEPAVTRSKTTVRRTLFFLFRISTVTVAGSDTVSWTRSGRPFPSVLIFTVSGRSSIDTTGGVFWTTKLWSAPSSATKSDCATARKCTVAPGVRSVAVASKKVTTLAASRRASGVVEP